MSARTFYIVLAVAACWIVVGWALSRWLGGYLHDVDALAPHPDDPPAPLSIVRPADRPSMRPFGGEPTPLLRGAQIYELHRDNGTEAS